MLYVDQAGGGVGLSGVLQVTAKAGNTLTLLNPQPAPAIPLASSAGSGLLARTSGTATDFIGGDNASHPQSSIPLDTHGACTDITALNTSSAAHGLMPKLPNTTKAYFRDDGQWMLPGNYYGADTTQGGIYAITVASDFVLTAGVVVWVSPTFTNTTTPSTLNVNGTGAKALVNRANIALNANEIIAPKTFGVVYDGTSWRVITPIFRFYSATSPVNPTIECAGYDAVTIAAAYSTQSGGGITLAHLGISVPVIIDISNNTATGMPYYINATNAAGASISVWWIWANAQAGAAAVKCDSTNIVSMSASTHFFVSGSYNGGSLFLK